MKVTLDYPQSTDLPTGASTFNGWANYETWNVALWINNDFTLYEIAKECENYREFVDYIFACGEHDTLDGVSYTDPRINRRELDQIFEGLK